MINLILNFLNDIKKNYKTLILAFIIACGLWLFVSIQIFPTIDKSITGINIETQLTDYMIQNNLQIVGSVSEPVNISIQGRRYDISDLDASNFYATVDFSSVRSAGTHTLPIFVFSKNDDREFDILSTEPSKVTLLIDEIITKEFTIQGTAPDIRLPEGYYVDDVTVFPERISLTGSASEINKIVRVEARSTYHGEITESRPTSSNIYLYDSSGIPISSDKITMSTDNVSVNIPIYRQKELPLKITITNYPSNFDINSLHFDIQPTSIIVAAPDDSIDNLSELNIGTINISDIQLNKNSSIMIVLPDGYKNLSGNNKARIEWDLEKYGTVDIPVTLTEENFNITNPPDNYDVSPITNEISIKVIGPSERIMGLSASDITVTVNLLGVSVHDGAQDVSVSVQIQGLRQQCWVTGQYRITINAQPKQEQNTESE